MVDRRIPQSRKSFRAGGHTMEIQTAQIRLVDALVDLHYCGLPDGCEPADPLAGLYLGLCWARRSGPDAEQGPLSEVMSSLQDLVLAVRADVLRDDRELRTAIVPVARHRDDHRRRGL
jgi:hypothetical protein